MTKLNISYKVLDRDFINEFGTPQYGTKGSAGMDLRANLENKTEIVLQPGQSFLVKTGIAIFINDSRYAAFIYPRSGQGHKRGIVLGNLVGVIDSDYQGELMVSLWNRSSEPQTIQHGERIAQLVIQRIESVILEEVDSFDQSERGAGGFGSTGDK
ncbi:dUTP diphosphatase [Psittacicella hinzii]|uniref:Deoxyuridine 5'-triphosphate nucleotidohydrolase n=1 Tax=Psittacicella hinzii TaxID=2028575 RepID=A0A3A1Y8U2_9GAMM|nr:dUTP diphosphatase [Psittacicella hinzii]RIY34602.1 deoxyuridine 5'-triphosphate nucleotidohydrolase [Psittacicella hinzii]